MSAQVFASVLVGLAVSALLFLPLLVWQYRRFGRFDGARMLWTTAGFVYATAIVAFTVFPLPDFGAGYCAAHRTGLVLDPLRLPRELLEVVRANGMLAAAGDWVVREAALNVLLFVPFGLIARRVFEWSRPAVLIAALSTSLLVEATQYTGNWGVAPCPYRVADLTDLITNTAGALLGIGLAGVTPRLLSTKAHLFARKDHAHPVTRGRRLLGMLLDAWYLGLAAVFGGTAGSVGYLLGHAGPGQVLTPDQLLAMEDVIFFGAWACGMVVVLVPAFTGTGASLGQRTVYLAVVSHGGGRWRPPLRALVVQGAVLTCFFAGLPAALLAPLWGTAAVVSAMIDPRGMSCLLTGCSMRDARGAEPRTTSGTGAGRWSSGSLAVSGPEGEG